MKHTKKDRQAKGVQYLVDTAKVEPHVDVLDVVSFRVGLLALQHLPEAVLEQLQLHALVGAPREVWVCMAAPLLGLQLVPVPPVVRDKPHRPVGLKVLVCLLVVLVAPSRQLIHVHQVREADDPHRLILVSSFGPEADHFVHHLITAWAIQSLPAACPQHAKDTFGVGRQVTSSWATPRFRNPSL